MVCGSILSDISLSCLKVSLSLTYIAIAIMEDLYLSSRLKNMT